MNKQEIKKAKELEKRCKVCPNYQEFKDKNWIRDGYCIAFKVVLMDVADYSVCPFDKGGK